MLLSSSLSLSFLLLRLLPLLLLLLTVIRGNAEPRRGWRGRLAGRSKWIDRGLGNLNSGCPTTAGIVVEQLRRVPDLTLAQSFQLELNVATHCAHNGDFHEGVRALLIDKDNAPAWRFGAIEHLEWAHVLSHFEAPWPAHPLADLA